MLSIHRVLLVAALALSGLSAPVRAQTPLGDPSRAITLVVPIAAGGGMDTIGRAVAEKLSERLKQPVVVENRTGAGGAVGVDYVAKAVPDGRTLLLMDISAVLHKWLHSSVPFDVVEDFAPVAQVATTPLLLFANPALPIADVKALIAHAKANPGKLSVRNRRGSAPPHSPPRSPCSMSAPRIDLTHVPYRGTAPRAQRSARRANPADLGDPQRPRPVRGGREGQALGGGFARAHRHSPAGADDQ